MLLGAYIAKSIEIIPGQKKGICLRRKNCNSFCQWKLCFFLLWKLIAMYIYYIKTCLGQPFSLIYLFIFFFLALVVLESGLEIEQLLLDLQNTKFQDNVINIDRCETEKLLCCAHLPHDYTVEKFRSLVAPFCAVKKCFLYRSQTTSKGLIMISVHAIY